MSGYTEQIVGKVTINRVIQADGRLVTEWELSTGMTYEEAITALEMTKLKLHHHMMNKYPADD